MIFKTKKFCNTWKQIPFVIVLNEDSLAKGCGTTTPTKLGCSCVFFFANMRAARIFITGIFFVRTRKFIMCKRAFYETSSKIGPDRCDTFDLLSLSFLYLGFDNVLGHCWGNLNWYQTKGDKILKTLMNEKNWINVQHGFSASKMVFFNANKRGDTFVLQ